MHGISRRDFLRLSALTSAATLAAACGQPAATEPAPVGVTEPTAAPPAEAPPAEAPPAEAPARFREAPDVANKVQAGELPPVEERLPTEPMIIPVVEEIGQYGGVWHRCAVGPGDAGIVNSRLGYEGFVRWTQDGSGVIPNVAKGYEISDDATEFTFYLREGMRWSDGEPFTADDLMFWFEDGNMNKDLTPTVGKWLRDPQNDQPLVLEKVDDYTVVFRSQSAYGLFIQMLAGPSALGILQWPKHYLMQFHPNYTPMDELQPKIEAANFTNWWELFGNRRNWQNPECPWLWAWHPERVPPDVPIVTERNPYYWKVDPEGNQLPYIDSLYFDVVENQDLLNMKAVAGEIDCQFRHIAWTNYPIFVENAEQGDYRVMKWTLAEGSNCMLHPNMNHPDPAMRELFENRDFRIALSLGLDRVTMNELAYQGFGVPRQASVVPQCPYFKEEHATRYAEHDPDQANEVLDAMGLTDRDGEGFRLRPDGEPLSIVIEYAPVFGPWRDVVTMACEQWKDIGIRGIPKEEDRTLYSQRCEGNEIDMGVWTMDRCFTPLIEPIYFYPIRGGTPGSSGALWYDWWTSGGSEGEEPPEEVKSQYLLYDQIKGAPPDQLPALAQEFFDRASEQVWLIGTVGVLPHVGIVKNNFRNVPEDAISDWLQLTPGNTNVEQYFWKAG